MKTKSCKSYSVLILCIISILFASCKQSPSPTPQSLPTTTSLPTAISSPTEQIIVVYVPTMTPYVQPLAPLPIRIPGWEDAKVSDVCIYVEQNFVDGLTLPVEEITSQILAKAGIEVVVNASQCDANLNLTITGKALGAYYLSGSRSCTFEGSEVIGDLTISDMKHPTVTFRMKYTFPPPIHGSRCASDPREAPFDRSIAPAILSGLVKIWDLESIYKEIRLGNLLEVTDSAYRFDHPVDKQGVIEQLKKYAKESNDPVYRALYIWALGEFGQEAKSAIPTILPGLGDNDNGVCFAASDALAKIGSDAIPELLNFLRSNKNSDKAIFAALAIKEMEGSVEYVSTDILLAMIEGLQNYGVFFERYDISWTLKANDYEESAIRIIKRLTPTEIEEIIPILIQNLQSLDSSTKTSAAWIIGQIGPQAIEATPYLIDALTNWYEAQRNVAIDALIKIQAEPSIIIPVLAKMIEDPWVSKWAIRALGEIGPKAKEVTPILMKILLNIDGENDDSFRQEAAVSLGKIGLDSEEVVTALVNSLTNVGVVRDAATEALGRLSPGADVAIPELIKHLNCWDPYVVISAIIKLGVVSQDSDQLFSVINKLIGCLTNYPEQAARALGLFEHEAEVAIPALTKALQNEDVWVQKAALSSLVAILPQEEIKPILFQALVPGNSWEIYIDAAHYINSLRIKSKEAYPLLIGAWEISELSIRGDLGYTAVFVEALKYISGNDLGPDVNAWKLSLP